MRFGNPVNLAALLGVTLFVAPGDSTLYQPRAIARTYTKGTRSPDGRPGPNYWQNHARYTIAITALPPDRSIKGTEQITYFNNSPDTLKRLNFKVLLNIHRPGAPRLSPADDDYLTSGVHVDSFTQNGQPAKWNANPGYFTNIPANLATALLPHDSVRMAIQWHFDLSKESGREGMIDSTTYFLAYFYPRVAVYDDYNGWDTMTFTDAQEFYSDFNDYDVSISVPANYIVWGTGTLTNAAAVLQPSALQRYQTSFISDTTIHVATKQDLLAKSVTNQQPVNTWHFQATNVPDVTFALSDHFDWDAASVLVDDAAQRRASVQAAYNDGAADFHRMVQYGRHALDWFSHNWPGVPYPYEKSTVVRGFAGMEYPMMVNDETYPDTTFSRFVVEHEMAHTYFPFYMGINETRYAFMDEGWATTLEYLVGQVDLGKPRADSAFQQFRVTRWINNPSPTGDLPIITPEDVLSSYGDNAYGKAALGYLAAKDLLGDALFKKALLEYISRWHGKHPTPWDFFYTFNDATGTNLNWFWNAWYFTNSYIDLGIGNISRTARGSSVELNNIGGMPAPVDVVVQYTDGTTATVHETPSIWKSDSKRATVVIPGRSTIRSVELRMGIWMDADTSNNKKVLTTK